MDENCVVVCDSPAPKRPSAREYSPAVAPVARRVRKRPAAAHNGNAGEYSSVPAVPARYEDDNRGLQGLPRMREVEEPAWARIPEDYHEALGLLPWADDIVHTLVSHDHLPRSSQKKIELQVWSDCSGINSEKFAWNELQDSIRRIIGADVSLELYYTCDADAKSIAFAQANHHPHHVGTNMSQRNFNTGEFWCAMHEGNFPIPKHGVDVYVGTYPCSPWSRRGSRTGWDHPSVEAFRIGLNTLSYIQPAVWIIELGELPENAALDEIMSGIQEVLIQDRREYTIQIVRSLAPAAQGYPIRRRRTYFIGWRSDVCPDSLVAVRPLHDLIQAARELTSTYRGFLQIQHPYDWSGVGCFYVGAALAYMSGVTCRCTCNPYVLCPVHLCKCDKCGHDGLQCAWRSQFQQFLQKECLLSQAGAMDGKLTYINALEMQGGIAPAQPRARVLLNMLAMLPQSQPLDHTLMLVDKSQNPPFGTWPTDGLAPTLTTTSQLWCMSAGRELKAWELALLMGFRTNNMVLKGQSEAWFRKRLGLAVHAPNFGLVLAAAMAHPLRACLASPP